MNEVKRYDPELDWDDCCYEGDEPRASMFESSLGDYVKYSDHKELQAKLDSLMLEFEPESMSPEQLQRWSSHQKPYE